VAYLRNMTGSELKSIREAFGLSASAMGRALGYSGPRANVAVLVRRFERDARPIPPPVARLAQRFMHNGIPKEWYA
jgi:hypothetical protein